MAYDNTLRLFVATFLFFFTSATIWTDLAANNTLRLAALTRVTDRGLGISPGDVCIGPYFKVIPPNLREHFIAFMCTAFGGALINDTSSPPECVYSVGGGPTLFSDNVTQLFEALQEVHQPLNISTEEQEVTKSQLVANFLSFGIDPVLLTRISILLDSTDSFIINNSTGSELSRQCPTPLVINWQISSPSTNSQDTVGLGQSVCWRWSDSDDHTVAGTGANAIQLLGFGGGNSTSNAFGNASSCNSTAAGQPCSLTLPPQYCYRFDNLGTYTFDCAIHGTSMVSNINVAVQPSTSIPPSNSPSASTSTDAASSFPDGFSNSGANTMSSFLF